MFVLHVKFKISDMIGIFVRQTHFPYALQFCPSSTVQYMIYSHVVWSLQSFLALSVGAGPFGGQEHGDDAHHHREMDDYNVPRVNCFPDALLLELRS